MSTNSPTLVFFDLDNTLLPIDSDHAWGHFLVELGVVNQEEYEQANNRFYAAYKAGTLNIDEFLNFALKPLASHPRKQLETWHNEFMQKKIEPQIHPKAIELVNQHLDLGHICSIVTATNSFVTKPIATRFGIQHLIATEPEIRSDGEFTGKVRGLPNFQAGKVVHVENWLKSLGLSLDHAENSIFYSDSMNDLPLLEKVKVPVATNPDPRLAHLAQERAWKILHLFA
ncbi:haloacid dehalogenase [Polynucleobacter sp. SHI8]|uniref:histidinol-phosphatase n=1 Tax=unclassified Polynucleobacter TaxID=2640945 RepID=UPI0024932EE5|nr:MULTISPECIES: HAD family hydrolase [unclassified Polynucleobacter]BDW11948.1 haloacid dehalogenase [Polynucleobacter sp. SHI2]BDW14395.1 haloacid dehalogenase [Polynucleobacter sp. SHI8]